MKKSKIKKYLDIYEEAKDEFMNNKMSRYPQQAHEFALKVMELEAKKESKVIFQKPSPII